MSTSDKRVEELVKELRMVANMINMGEKIQWARETTLMDEAADRLEALTQYHQDLMSEVVEEIEKKKRKEYQDAHFLEHRSEFNQGFNAGLTEAQTIIKLSK